MDGTAVFYGVLIGLAVARLISGVTAKTRTADAMRLEQKIDLLLRKSGVTYDPFDAVAPEVAKVVRSGDMVRAIKLHREHTGDGLKAAKDTIDQLKAHAAARR